MVLVFGWVQLLLEQNKQEHFLLLWYQTVSVLKKWKTYLNTKKVLWLSGQSGECVLLTLKKFGKVPLPHRFQSVF